MKKTYYVDGTQSLTGHVKSDRTNSADTKLVTAVLKVRMTLKQMVTENKDIAVAGLCCHCGYIGNCAVDCYQFLLV